MKRIYLIVVISLSTLTIFAQNIFPTSGNAGIGTLNPVGNLDIFDSRNMTITPLISIRSNFHVIGNYGMIKFGDYTQTTDYQKGAIIYESVQGSARGKFHIALENTDSPGSVTLSDARFTVLSNGNVGAGMVNPNEKLAVNGVVRAREVKVETTNWPDYVFTPTYPLMPLHELENYISKNGHLPEIPPAEQILKEGIELGEMNKKLLQKIEELSIYIIRQEKRLDEQEVKAIQQLRLNEKQSENILKLQEEIKNMKEQK